MKKKNYLKNVFESFFMSLVILTLTENIYKKKPQTNQLKAYHFMQY